MSDNVLGDSGVEAVGDVWGWGCSEEERGGEDNGEELQLMVFVGGLGDGCCDLVWGARMVMVK